MRRVMLTRGVACTAAVVVGLLCAAATPRTAAADDAQLRCAQTLASTQQQSPSTSSPCWTEVEPYPFGTDGNPVDLTSPSCRPIDGAVRPACYLTVTSLAFRAWNRGLAATASPPGSSDPFRVWLFNGGRWFPDPTFPGPRACPGSVVLWAGKLDYWLIGTGPNWPNICRFDGSSFLWQPLPLPRATVTRGTALDVATHGGDAFTGITSGACSAWNDCWFFGTYGTMVHWDGRTLSDASPSADQRWLGTEFTGAVIRSSAGSRFGVAVGSGSFGSSTSGGPLPPEPDGSAPPQLFVANGPSWAPTIYEPPTAPLVGDPYRTDLVAVAFDDAGHGWVAGNPAGWRVGRSQPAGRTIVSTPEPAPLQPIGPVGNAPAGCTGPPIDRFTRSPAITGHATDSFLWSSLAVLPGSGQAIAGGQVFPAGSSFGEPVLAQTDCVGGASLTEFRVPDPGDTGPSPALVPADRNGWVQAVAATASNDAWAATKGGNLGGTRDQPPRLYRYSDGSPPRAPAGDDVEPRPLDLKQDAPIVVFDPLPPPPLAPPPPAPVTTTTTTTETLPPAVSGIKSKLSTKTKKVRRTVRRGERKFHVVRFKQSFTLRLTFTVARPAMLGLVATRNGRVVASTGLKSFSPPRGQLRIKLTRARWPKAFAFTTDAPTATLTDPGQILTGTVTLNANAKAIARRTIASTRFEYSASGADTWTEIGTTTAAPYSVRFDTTTIADGLYDLRVVATDSTGRAGVSSILRARRVDNGSGG